MYPISSPVVSLDTKLRTSALAAIPVEICDSNHTHSSTRSQ